jgi:hypothetical protein
MLQYFHHWAEIALRSSEIAGLAALLIAIVKIVWSVMDWISRTVRFHLARKLMRYDIDFGPFDGVPDDIEGVYCQVVRYGTDQYIEKMASEQEKFEGRLQNKVIRLSASKDRNGLYVVHLRLPVHRRIGTQFRLFVRVKPDGDMQKVNAFLSSIEVVSDVHPALYKRKLTFTVDIFPVVETVEGLKNNFFYPV